MLFLKKKKKKTPFDFIAQGCIKGLKTMATASIQAATVTVCKYKSA